MEFDQKMILDATRGSIARFINHSCEPNCEMIKMTVAGKPRMALFAGENGIMTGEELTYDYNFNPYSVKNVQQCRCGVPSCRGVLGPKPKEIRDALKPLTTGGKRKFQQALEDGLESMSKKRKINVPTGLKKVLHSAKAQKTESVSRSRSGQSGKANRGNDNLVEALSKIPFVYSQDSSNVKKKKTSVTSSHRLSTAVVVKEEAIDEAEAEAEGVQGQQADVQLVGRRSSVRATGKRNVVRTVKRSGLTPAGGR